MHLLYGYLQSFHSRLNERTTFCKDKVHSWVMSATTSVAAAGRSCIDFISDFALTLLVETIVASGNRSIQSFV